MDALSVAMNYLAPHGDSFWRWSPDNEALEWSDGTVIAFYDEVYAVIEILGTRSLPPFQSIVMVLAACQYNWQSTSRGQILIGYAQGLQQDPLRTRLEPGWQGQILEKLDRLHALLSEQQGTTEFKRSIAEKLFDKRSTKEAPHGTDEILEQLRMGIPSLVLSEPGDEASQKTRTDDFIASVRCLLTGGLPEDPEAIKRRIDTGISDLPKPAEFEDEPELPDVERLRRLLNHLSTTGDELAGIARVAQDLMAAVHLPRTIAEPDQMPLGGFSDITNRGPLDRLLITELAHDNETLAMRVALNEALYLRRESPPKTPQRRRALLIDTGIRLWGIPRIFASSVALALAATAEKHSKISCFRTDAEQIVESDLLSQDGLVEHLAALDPSPHPAAATIGFLDRWDDDADGVDPVLITHAKVLADTEFRRLLRERLKDDPLYVATVDNSGEYELFAFSAAGQRRLQHAKINLEKLVQSASGEPDTSELLRDDIDSDLPAIFSLRPFPLRVPYQFDSRRSTYTPDVGVLTHTRDGRLLLWDKKRLGARLLSSEIPAGKIVWSRVDAARWLVHLLIKHDGFTLFTVEIGNGTGTTQLLRAKLPERGKKSNHPYTFCHHGSSLFIIYDETAEMYSTYDGSATGTLALPHSVRAQHGRFLRFGGEWHALCGGDHPRLEKIQPPGENIIQVFESPVIDAPLGLAADGRLMVLNGGDNPRIAKFELGQHGRCTMSDDQTLIGTAIVSDSTYLFDLNTKTFSAKPRVPLDRALNQEKYQLAAGNPSPHLKFRSIAVSNSGHLILTSPKGVRHRIHKDPRGLVLHGISPVLREKDDERTFQIIEAPGEARFSLVRATWPCGSHAYLDSRGFLHLAHCSHDLPQITFALIDGLLSGWTSMNRFFGQEFFIDPHPAQAPDEVATTLERITARILAYREAHPE